MVCVRASGVAHFAHLIWPTRYRYSATSPQSGVWPARLEWSLATPGGRRRLGGTEAGLAKHGRGLAGSAPMVHFFLLSLVRRNRNDSVPVSTICARSVMRSSSALHSRGFGNTVVHSENGRFVVTMSAALSARSEIT